MALRFQKRVSLFPGVRLNFSLSGVSTTIGVPGASITLGGRRGPTANLGIPGTGLSFRTPLTQKPKATRRPSSQLPDLDPAAYLDPPEQYDISPLNPPPMSSGLTAIQSESVDSLTTSGLAAFKDLIVEGQNSRTDAAQTLTDAQTYLEAANKALAEAQSTYEATERKLARLQASWFARFRKGRIAATRTHLAQTSEKWTDAANHVSKAGELFDEAEARHSELYVDLDFGLSGAAHAAWTRLSEAFDALTKSEKIWDVTAARKKRAGAERSIATEVIDRQPTKLAFSELPLIQTQYKPLRFHNVNGADILLYPGFVVVFQTEQQFAILELPQVQIRFELSKFQEEEAIPADAESFGVTWKYSNRDGTPDRRYADNPSIPVVAYGKLDFRSNTGLAESYMFSHARAAADFCDRLTDFRNALVGR